MLATLCGLMLGAVRRMEEVHSVRIRMGSASQCMPTFPKAQTALDTDVASREGKPFSG